MNTYDILYSMDYIENDLIEEAAVYNGNKKRRIIIKCISAACVILAVGITGINIQNSISIKNRDITQRFGMLKVDPDVEKPLKLNATLSDIYPYFEYLYKITTEYDNFDVIYGTVKNITTVKKIIPSPASVYYITAFDIDIIKSYRVTPEKETVKAISISCKRMASAPDIGPSYFNISEGQSSIFTLWAKNARVDWSGIEDLHIDPYDYADYVVSTQFDTDDNGAKIAWYGYMTFEEIQELFDNAPYNKEYLLEKYGT